MFGCQAHLPVDIMYSTREQALQSHGEYARDLQVRLHSAFGLVRKMPAKNADVKKASMTCCSLGDLAWLHTPAGYLINYIIFLLAVSKLSRKCHHIQQLNGNRQQKVVHFVKLSHAQLHHLSILLTLTSHQTDNSTPVTMLLATTYTS